MELSTEIKDARAKLGLSQEEAARRWGVNLGTLRQYEQGKRTPRGLAMTMLRQILDAAMAGKPTSAPSASPSSEADAPPAPPKEKRRRRSRKTS